MSVLPFEGTHDILYGSRAVQSGLSVRPAYLARPDAVGAFPAVMVQADADHVSSSLKDLCRRLARHGYVAAGVGAGLESLRDLDSFLASPDTPFVAEAAPAIVAIGAGGTSAIDFSLEGPPPAGLVFVSARIEAPFSELALPTLGLFAREDEVRGVDAAHEAREMAPHGEWVIYDEVGSDFFDDGSDGYSPAVAEDAFERILGFLAGLFPRSV